MTTSDSAAGPEGESRNERVASTSKLDALLRRMSPLGRFFPDAAFVPVVAGMFVLGAVLIILYVVSTVGPYLRYISVGLFTACAAFLIGSLVGLVLAIPRIVSSGAYGYQTSIQRINRLSNKEPDGPSPADSEAEPVAVTDERGQEQREVPRLLPSTNLAEISDWLTKLLLGAGLVSLTRLGQPLGELIDNVARGLGGATPSGGVTESAVVIAGAILITYIILGFLGGYLTTAFWYGRVFAAKMRGHKPRACFCLPFIYADQA
jgi:hypothetical protein